MFDGINMIWITTMISRPYLHSYLHHTQSIKERLHSNLCTTILVNNRQMKAIPSCDTYQVCPRWWWIVGFGHLFVHACSCGCSIPLEYIGHLFTLQEVLDTCIWDVCHINGFIVWSLMAFALNPHQVHIGKWWLCGVLDLYTLALRAKKMSLIFYPNNKHEKGWLHGICMVIIK